MSFTRPGGRVLPSLIILLTIAILGLAGAGVALAIGPPAVSGLVSSTHPDQSTWYSDSDPGFTWGPMLGVEGFSYTLDQTPGTVPTALPVSLPALDFADKQELSVGDPAAPPDIPYSGPADTALADLNGDGNLDIVVADKGQSYASVLLGDGGGGFAPAVDYQTYPDDYPGWDGLSYLLLEPHSVTVGDIGSDGHPDIVVSNSADGTISVLHGNGDGTFGKPDWYAWGGSGAGDMRQIVTGNLDGDADGIDEIMAAAPLQNAVFVYHAAADGSLVSRDVVPVGGTPEALATGDFNGDSHVDLAVSIFDDAAVSILLGDGTGGFAAPVDYGVGSQPHSIATGDFDGDGVTDLAVANWASNNVSVLLGKGDGTFEGKMDTNPIASVTSAVAAADLNGDGDLDLAVTDWNSDTLTVLLGAGVGTFPTDATFSYETGVEPMQVSAGDLDKDGLPDLVVAPNGLDSGAVDVFLDKTVAPLRASFTGKADGVWYFHIRAVDSADNGGDTVTRTVRIDTTPPVTTDDAPHSFVTPSIAVHLTPADVASGMTGGSAGTWYKLDGAASFTAGTSVTVSGVGNHTLQYYSKDAAGNTETTKSATIAGQSVTRTFTLTPGAGTHGSITPSTQQTVDEGGSQTFTITPDTGYHVADVLVDGSSVGAVTSYQFQNVNANHAISASFAIDTFTITVTAGDHGAITPGTGIVDYGSNATYAITPDAGYLIESLTVDGVTKPVQTSWTFTNVAASHSVTATFAPKVKPALGTPKSSKTTIKRNGSFTVSGSISPSTPGAPKVRIKAYRLQGKKWVTYKYFSAKVTGTKYSATIKIARTGKFQFKAYSTADAAYLAATSSMSKTMTVKK